MARTRGIQPRMSDEAVRAKTGRTWTEWLAALERAGASKLTHQQIVAYLKGEHRLSAWWCQMVTVTYEQAKGLRDKHEKPSGYEIGVSKTIAAPLSRLFRAWEDRKIRDKWLEDPGFVIRKATPGKSMRITWVDGKTSVDAGFYMKGDGKSQISVQHGRLGSAREAARLKTYWAEQLGKLKELLEG
jgi:uncharacterized protein YndB with AHSA1/START domain